MPNTESLQFTSSLTIEAWINLNSFGSGSDVDIILRKGEDNPNNYQLAVNDQKLALTIEENDGEGLQQLYQSIRNDMVLCSWNMGWGNKKTLHRRLRKRDQTPKLEP